MKAMVTLWRIYFFFITRLLLIERLSAQSSSPCSTDVTSCSCDQSEGSTYTISCDRVSLDRVPRLTSEVVELHMFRTDLLDKTLGSTSLRLASSLQVFSIESCDLVRIERTAFTGLYSMTSLNLAYNDLHTLPHSVFSDLNLLQTLDLSYNSLLELHSEMFTGPVNLQTLDLSYNSISELPANLLKHLPSLKHLRLENTLISVTILPDLFLSYTPQLESLNLNNNKISQLQTVLFDYTAGLRELSLKGNDITSLSAEVFSGRLTQLSVLELQNNPFICDCNLTSFKTWIDSMSSKSWTYDATGRCNSPSDLQGEYISTLPPSRLVCTTTASNPTTLHSTSRALTQSHTSGDTEGVVLSTDHVTEVLTQQPAVQPIEDNKSLESSLIIGCSVGGAFLFIILNVLIICCVRKAKLQKNSAGARRIKYIIKPGQLDKTENPEDLYSRPFKQPTVESCNGNSYMISNGSSGFYHTGSRSRLYGTDLEDTIYSTPPKLPPKIDLYCEIPTPKLQVKSDNSTLTRREHNSTLNGRESTSRTIASSVYNVPMDDSYPTEYSTDQGSFYVPQYPADTNHITPVTAVTSSDHPARKQLSYSDTPPTNKHLSTNVDDGVFEFDIYPPVTAHDTVDLIPESEVDPDKYKKYYGFDNYYDITSHTARLAESQEFKVGSLHRDSEGGDIKHSTGSGADSGVHSYTPTCHEAVTDTLTSEGAPVKHGACSITRSMSLNSYHTNSSPSQKKIRNETYV